MSRIYDDVLCVLYLHHKYVCLNMITNVAEKLLFFVEKPELELFTWRSLCVKKYTNLEDLGYFRDSHWMHMNPFPYTYVVTQCTLETAQLHSF